MIKFYRVIKGGRNCLKNQRTLQVGDVLCCSALFSNFAFKAATPTEKLERTSVFCSEPEWDTQSHLYEVITCTRILKKLVPHLPGSKYCNLKKEMQKQLQLCKDYGRSAV